MSLSGASASAAAKQRHQEQLRADTSALVDAARGQRQMPELPPYVPEFDLAFMSQMLGVGAVRSEPEDPATGDDETMMQEHGGGCIVFVTKKNSDCLQYHSPSGPQLAQQSSTRAGRSRSRPARPRHRRRSSCGRLVRQGGGTRSSLPGS